MPHILALCFLFFSKILMSFKSILPLFEGTNNLTCSKQPLAFTGFSGTQFFDSPPYPNTVWPPLVPYPSPHSTCVTYGMPCHSICLQMLPAQLLPRQAENFPNGDKYFKYVPLLTYLIYFPPKGITW